MYTVVVAGWKKNWFKRFVATFALLPSTSDRGLLQRDNIRHQGQVLL